MTASLFLAQANLALDFAFQQRITAVVYNETSLWPDPPTIDPGGIASGIAPLVAAAPGFANSYLWGDEDGGLAPGQDAITDASLLAAVQPLLEDYRPEPTP